MAMKPDAPATLRNREPILEVLREELADVVTVLEIGSGTGQHAVYFGRALPRIKWQTSDRACNHAGIAAWIDESGLDNVALPIDLDVLESPDFVGEYDAIFSANTAHIMGFAAVVQMFGLVGRSLGDGGRFCLYGPLRINGEFTSDSNRHFDQSLREQDPQMGLRDLNDLDRLARENGLARTRLYALPANNHLVVWRKSRKC